MQNSLVAIPKPANEPVLTYAPGSPERTALKSELARLGSTQLDIPLLIGGKEVRTGKTATCIEPHNHGHVLATYHKAGAAEVERAIAAARAAKRDWEAMPWQMRAAIFIKAAELLARKYRFTLNAATMLNQSKNPFQAEIDSACELVDFWRFNPFYMQELYRQQPDWSPTGTLNSAEWRALEGFVFAITPFNFTSIGGNLPTAPAMMGNTVLWKPASTAVYSGWFIMKLLQEAGLPDGVINFLPGSGREVGDPVLASPQLAGIHFTGSTGVFHDLWKTIGSHIASYASYPRIVGETGGKDFVFVHASADVPATVTALVRGSFEYQGQKCSAVSRAYIPSSLWPAIKDQLVSTLKSVTMGPVQDFSNFMNAVIDTSSFENTMDYIAHARKSPDAEIVCGGKGDNRTGFFIEPTVIQARAPRYKTMVEEIFAPVLTVYVYPDAQLDDALALCDTTSPYALTGAVFAQDRAAVLKVFDALRHAAGNFYINDKPTGAVVGQQPFGGTRGSGTNDKAGSLINLQRWTSMRTVKENFLPPADYRYPFMQES